MNRLALTALCLALLQAGCGIEPGPPPQEVPTDDFFGVNGQAIFQLETSSPDTLLVENSLTEISNLGIAFVRANVIWPELEPQPPEGSSHSYELSGLDDWVAALARHGLRWQALVMGVPTPGWAGLPPATGCGFRSAPRINADVASLAAALAERYGKNGSLWNENPGLPFEPVRDYEIWNEPNHGAFWCPGPDPERYADLVVDTAARIRELEPSARVIVGGLANFHETTPAGAAPPMMAADEFVRRMTAHRPDLAGVVDAVAVHPYAQDPGQVLSEISWFRELLDKAGLAAVPMMISEVGWDTNGVLPGYLMPVPEETRAEYLQTVVAAITSSDCDVITFTPHTWTTPEQDEGNPEDWFGIADPATGEPYETAKAYGRAILAAGTRSKPGRKLTPCEDLR